MQNKSTAFPNRIWFFLMEKRKEQAVSVNIILLHSCGICSRLGLVFHCSEITVLEVFIYPTDYLLIMHIYAYVFFNRFFRLAHHIYFHRKASCFRMLKFKFSSNEKNWPTLEVDQLCNRNSCEKLQYQEIPHLRERKLVYISHIIQVI